MFAEVRGFGPGSAARLEFPRPYNAACDLVDRHVVEGRGDRVAFTDETAHGWTLDFVRGIWKRFCPPCVPASS